MLKNQLFFLFLPLRALRALSFTKIYFVFLSVLRVLVFFFFYHEGTKGT